MFDTLLRGKASSSTNIGDEIDRYLATEVEVVEKPLLWWAERKKTFPGLSRMALDYLSIPGTIFFDIFLVTYIQTP